MAKINQRTATAGNHGDGIRSDCRISIKLKEKGGINLQVNSKVQVMFGKENEKLLRDILSFYGIKNAEVVLEDSGALPLVLAARMEAALKKLVK